MPTGHCPGQIIAYSSSKLTHITQCYDHQGVPNEYDSIATVGEIRVYRRADFQSGSRVLKKVF